MANDEPKKKIVKIKIDRGLCIGAASCVAVAPGSFELDAENKAVLIRKSGANNSELTAVADLAAQEGEDALMLAAQSCPTKAIFVYDEDGNQLYP